MKYVYVLVSSEDDLYYEQALMSVWSLKFQMPQAHVIVLCDDVTEKSLCGKRDALKDLATEIRAIPFDASTGKAERSRLIKTAIPDYVDGDFLYIDCDTVICGDLSEIERFDFPVVAVLDGHVPLNEHIHRDYFLKREKKSGYTGTKEQSFHINSGVILYKDCEKSRSFFRMWHRLWLQNYERFRDHHDQGPFNEAFHKMGFGNSLLPGEWNCQPSHGGLAFLKDAKIIHYYSSEFAGRHYIPYYRLADKTLQQRIKEAGEIPGDIQAMLREPKFQFNKVHLINDRRIVGIMQSPLVFTLADIKEKLPWLFRFWEAQAAFVRALGKRLKGK